MDRRILLQQVEDYVRQLFHNADTSTLLYHNFNHTKQVVERTREIADHNGLSIHSEFVILSAAWFHDTGLLSAEFKDHEEKSVQIMKYFFADKNIDNATIENISQTIIATKLPVHPVTQLDMILCDADNWYAGTSDFHRLYTFAWNEFRLKSSRDCGDLQEASLRYLQSVQFYTDYCIRKLSAVRKINIELIKMMLLRENNF